jgi:ribosomal protein L40E
MAKIQEAMDRIFKDIFVCKKCSSKIRASSQKVLQNKIKCRKCGAKRFRPIKKK